MDAVVFLGPTLPAGQAREVLDASYLPPAAQGDVLRAAHRRPLAIGIVDGYFQAVPTVWHKEILWAMCQGVHVLGAASMGALRAAELERYGMRGVGTVFDAYRSGEVEDDDEVAVVHGPAEAGYPTFSDAMVNIRATLERARAADIIRPATRAALERIAKDIPYRDRRYSEVVRRGRAAAVPAAELDAFAAWWPSGAVDQKRLDALAMLREMRDLLGEPAEPMRVSFEFEWTHPFQTSLEASLAMNASVRAPTG